MKHTFTTKTTVLATALALGLGMGTPCNAMKRPLEDASEKGNAKQSSQNKLFESVKSGNYGMTLLLLNDMSPNIKDKDGLTLLYWAVQNGHADIVQTLLDAGANVNLTNENENATDEDDDSDVDDDYTDDDTRISTPLNLAIINAKDHPNLVTSTIVRMLLNAGANVDDSGNENFTPLHVAACQNNDKVVEMLIIQGADIEAKDQYDEDATPLHRAAASGYPEVVKMLITHNAKVNAQDTFGDTPPAQGCLLQGPY